VTLQLRNHAVRQFQSFNCSFSGSNKPHSDDVVVVGGAAAAGVVVVVQASKHKGSGLKCEKRTEKERGEEERRNK
jgi:hypothetical protein